MEIRADMKRWWKEGLERVALVNSLAFRMRWELLVDFEQCCYSVWLQGRKVETGRLIRMLFKYSRSEMMVSIFLVEVVGSCWIFDVF